MKNNKYDTILVVDNSSQLLTEQKRGYASPGTGEPGSPESENGYADYIDPTLYASAAFGNALRSSLGSLSSGYFSEVTDFGKWVVVRVGYHNLTTGRSAEKTFLIVFKHKGDGMVFSTSNKWRTISGASQAASYIRSACSSLSNSTYGAL